MPSSSTSADELAEEVPRDARGRILKTGGGGGGADAPTAAAGDASSGEAAGEESADELRAIGRWGTGDETVEGAGSGAGTYVASLRVGLPCGSRQLDVV